MIAIWFPQIARMTRIITQINICVDLRDLRETFFLFIPLNV